MEKDRESHTSEVTAGKLDPRALKLQGQIYLGNWFRGPWKRQSENLLFSVPEPGQEPADKGACWAAPYW